MTTKGNTVTEQPAQLTAEDLATLSPAAIVQAQRDGLCADLLGVVKPVPFSEWSGDSERQVTAADLPKMTPTEIFEAKRLGRCNDLMRGARTTPTTKETT
jgi:hypothetical protein